MPRLSIIIPWQDDTSAFEDTLVSVLQNRPEHCEILVVHPPEYQDPYDLGDEVCFLVSPARREIDRINLGIEAARGDFVHVLRCGLEAVEGWVEPALARFDEGEEVASVAPVIVQRGDRNRVATTGVTYHPGGTRRLCGVGRRLSRIQRATQDVIAPTLSAGFYRRDLLVAWGGFDESVGQSLADVDLGMVLKQFDLRCEVALDSLVVGAVEQRETQGFEAGRQAERLFWRHAGSRPTPWQRVRHSFTSTGACLRQLPSLRALTHYAGRLVGWTERQHYRQHQQRLADFKPARVLQLANPLENSGENHLPLGNQFGERDGSEDYERTWLRRAA